MKVLAVGCHPDDLEIGCFGTLAKYVKQGHDVAVCNVANGNLGHVEIMPDELREVRMKEAQSAARLIGAQYYAIDIGDLHVSAENNKLVARLAKVIRDVQPDMIITHNDRDYMNDHMQTYLSVFRATFAASCNHYDVNAHPASAPITPLYHMDTLTGADFLPTEYVDISDVIDLKMEALSQHQSQIKWMLEHDGIDFMDMVRTCSKARGYQCGVAYAEGFRLNRNYLRMVPKRMLP